MFFAPEGGGYFLGSAQLRPGRPAENPAHLAPVWYFTPFYAILRAIPSFLGTQVWGVLGMGAAVVLIALLAVARSLAGEIGRATAARSSKPCWCCL